jgi:hypothetical protein
MLFGSLQFAGTCTGALAIAISLEALDERL